MSIALLDVNVLVALFDPAHVHHESAHQWFSRNRRSGWATCPITVNGCIRVLSNPAYPTVDATPAEVAARLSSLCGTRDHHWWPDSVSLTDATLFQLAQVRGHNQLTDAYLLGLSVRNHGKLVTFDRSIRLKAVPAATTRNLVILEPSGDWLT